jgi:Uma2 family endonuclease
MATTATHVPVEVYLDTNYEHDCDYIRGEVLERPLGGWDHATWQANLVMFFGLRQKKWCILVRPELRVQVSKDNYRVPDICIVKETPVRQVVDDPPLAVIEILSPRDTKASVLERLADYERMGIPAIWVIEPEDSTYFLFVDGKLTPASVFHLPGTDHRVALDEIAALLD